MKTWISFGFDRYSIHPIEIQKKNGAAPKPIPQFHMKMFHDHLFQESLALWSGSGIKGHYSCRRDKKSARVKRKKMQTRKPKWNLKGNPNANRDQKEN